MSPALPVLKPKKIVRALEQAGFYIHHSSGSHVQMKHAGKPELRVTIPYHSTDVPPGTLNSIIRQSGLSREEFLKLL
jgi:predicted RNA binding protein YcfA (HicA-like mRNA interferase family)